MNTTLAMKRDIVLIFAKSVSNFQLNLLDQYKILL